MQFLNGRKWQEWTEQDKLQILEILRGVIAIKINAGTPEEMQGFAKIDTELNALCDHDKQFEAQLYPVGFEEIDSEMNALCNEDKQLDPVLVTIVFSNTGVSAPAPSNWDAVLASSPVTAMQHMADSMFAFDATEDANIFAGYIFGCLHPNVTIVMTNYTSERVL